MERTNERAGERVNDYKEQKYGQLLGHNFRVYGTLTKQTPTNHQVILKFDQCTNHGSIREETDSFNMINAFGIAVKKRLKKKRFFNLLTVTHIPCRPRVVVASHPSLVI